MCQALHTVITSAPQPSKQKSAQDSAKGTKVFFGTGLASSREESCGFGYELLNLVLMALVSVKEIGADSILHEIGTIGYNVSEETHSRLIEEQFNLIINMIENLGIDDIYSVELSQSYHDRKTFKSIKEEVEMKLHLFENLPNFQKYGEYTVIQIAQMKFLYETENAMTKIGWIIGNKPIIEEANAANTKKLIDKGSLNEYYFDSIYRYVFPDDKYSFIYTTAGVDIVDGKRYAPYTVTKSQCRPLLAEPIRAYLAKVPDSKHKRNALKAYEKSIVENWECLFGEIDVFNYIPADEKLITKLQYIQDIVLGTSAA